MPYPAWTLAVNGPQCTQIHLFASGDECLRDQLPRLRISVGEVHNRDAKCVGLGWRHCGTCKNSRETSELVPEFEVVR